MFFAKNQIYRTVDGELKKDSLISKPFISTTSQPVKMVSRGSLSHCKTDI